MAKTWPSAVVAVAFIAAVTTIITAALITTDVKRVLDVWDAIKPLVGVLIGIIPTYFFKQREVDAKDRELQSKDQQVQQASELHRLRANLEKLPPETKRQYGIT